ncbi:MAG: serine/threonine-protein kinase [Planctomycetota bacterium]
MTNQGTGPESFDDTLRKRFETAWADGRPEPIERFLPPDEDPNYAATLEGLVRIELDLAWKSWSKSRGEAATVMPDETEAYPPQVESYLGRFQRLNQPEVVLRLLKHECLVRRKYGASATVEEYRRRFPDLPITEKEFGATLPAIGDRTQRVDSAEKLPHGHLAAKAADEIQTGTFGNYELLGEIGRGGMGVVYRARQRSANRIVALKVIRRDRLEALPRDTQTAAVDRFWHEAQAAARLEHDNIVTVYEVGEVDGQPFFSMRYVEGRTLSEILQEGPMEGRHAAAYLEPVARAVHEAHVRGILHRDLKPQNILVDGKTGRALVADFGLAKLSEGGGELTRAGEVMGTPSYMSPEQARDSARVTETTDVYALGATLYHLLTARPPFQAATPVETLRQVIDEEPVPVRQLDPSIDRDLETICTKCLDKEPSRRYASAERLADDLARYLRREPILARPVGPIERTARWCRRNPVTAALIASTFTFLVVALVGTTLGMVQASLAREEAEAAQEQSEESFRQARAAVDNFYTRVSEDTLLNQPGMQGLRRELLSEAHKYYQEFLSQRGDDPTILDELATAHYREGCIAEVIDSPQSAMASYHRARRMQEQLVAQRPRDRECLQSLGNTLNAIARALHRQGKLDEARESHRDAIKIRTQLAREAPHQSEFQRTLANSHMNIGLIARDRGDPDEARRELEEAQKLRTKVLHRDPDDQDVCRDLAKGCYNLAVLDMMTGSGPAARKNFGEAVRLTQKLLDRDPQDLGNQHFLALCCRCQADVILTDPESTVADLNSAIGLYETAFEPMERLALANPDVAQYQAELASLLMNRGVVQRALGRSAEARDSFERAQGALVALLERHPGVAQHQETLGGLQMMLADLCREEQESYAALQAFKGAYDTLKDLAEAHPRVSEYRRDFVVTARQIALLQSELGYAEAARKNLMALKENLGQLVRSFPDTNDFPVLLEQTEADLAALDAAESRDE